MGGDAIHPIRTAMAGLDGHVTRSGDSERVFSVGDGEKVLI